MFTSSTVLFIGVGSRERHARTWVGPRRVSAKRRLGLFISRIWRRLQECECGK
jgi:hypothetical protein